MVEAALGRALACGMTVEAFYASTPYLTRLHGDAVARTQRDLALFASWHTEAFARTDRLPALSELLSSGSPPNRNATDDEMRAWLVGFTDPNMQ